MNAADELIRLYAKQLKVPSFAEYQEVLRQAAPSDGFADLFAGTHESGDGIPAGKPKQAAAESSRVPLPEDLGRI